MGTLSFLHIRPSSQQNSLPSGAQTIPSGLVVYGLDAGPKALFHRLSINLPQYFPYTFPTIKFDVDYF